MSDEQTTEVAESSPAEETTATQEPESQDAEIQETVDEEKETSESDPTEKEGEDEKEASSEDVKESGQPKPEPKSIRQMQKRINQLTAQKKSLEERLNAPKTEATDEKPLVEPKEPQLESFETLDAYNDALKKFKLEFGEYNREVARRETLKAETEKKQKAEKEKIQSEFLKREAKTMQRNPEYDRNEAYSTVRPSPTMDSFFVYSEIGPDVLHELHENPDKADRIREMPFWDQARELVKLESEISARIKGINPKPKPKSTPSYVEGSGASPAKPKELKDLLYG